VRRSSEISTEFRFGERCYTAKANAAYQDFLSLWEDADPDIPILKEACGRVLKVAVAENVLLRPYVLPITVANRPFRSLRGF
jgi:hypothetical protein